MGMAELWSRRATYLLSARLLVALFLGSTTTAAASVEATRVVSLFYIDERGFEGLPYTLFHRDSGAVVGVRGEQTTFVITTTRADQRPSPTHARTDNVTTGIPTLTAYVGGGGWWHRSSSSSSTPATGPASTITQGPATFEFTGPAPHRGGEAGGTVVNRCSLNGTVAAACNLTHIGAAWYTADPGWNGTYSTSSYRWTSGDRLGFAPVTITQGVQMMGPPQATITPSQNAAPLLRPSGGMAGWGVPGVVGWSGYGLGVLFPVFVLAVAVAL